MKDEPYSGWLLTEWTKENVVKERTPIKSDQYLLNTCLKPLKAFPLR